jgi:mannitol-specific phosphotransferase system IIBC component
MIILGLLLLVVAAIFGLDLIWKNHFTIRSPALFGQTLGIHNAAGFFILGVITGAVLLLGIAMVLAGMRRKGTKAEQHRAQRKEASNARHDRDQAQAERDRVQAENEKLHRRVDHDDIPTDASAGTHSSGATAAD